MARGVADVDPVRIFTRNPLSKTQFLDKCNGANGKLQTATLNFGRWLSSIAIACGEGFEAHNSVINQIKSDIKLTNDLVLGLALAFLSGGAGSVVGAAMKKLESGDFMVDGVKDLAKFGVKASGQYSAGEGPERDAPVSGPLAESG